MFIKPINITEMSLGISNDLWKSLENHIGDSEEWFNKLIKTSKWSSQISDATLEAIIKNYFFTLLERNNINLIDLKCNFYKTDEADSIYGKCSYNLLNSSNKLKHIKEIKAKIDIYMFRLLEVNSKDAIKILYHELIHCEELTKALINIGTDKMFNTIPQFEWVSADLVINKKENKTEEDYINDISEINAYAGELALQLYYKYKLEFKDRTTKEQDYFIRTKIIPNIKNEFSNSIQVNYINKLIKSNKFYIALIKQLSILASHVAINE
jgi:hypothetical protein